MNDYKELIADLTAAANRNSNSLNTRDTCRKAADAIEQLVKERDAAVEDIKKNLMCASCAKRETGSEWGRCEELDYAKNDEGVGICKSYEWRGVQE